MAKKSPENSLEQAISALRSERNSLLTERNSLLSRVSEIDASFARLGIKIEAAVAAVVTKRRGRPPKAVAAPITGKKRGPKPGKKAGKTSRYGVSAEEFVLAFVAKAGQPNAAEVNQTWSKQGRKGKADNSLTKLVKDGKLVRVTVEGERGGRYKLA
jgi:hypothetical protein